MTTTLLRSSTALIAAIGLTAGPASAQDTEAPLCQPEEPTIPCLLEDGTLVETDEAFADYLATLSPEEGDAPTAETETPPEEPGGDQIEDDTTANVEAAPEDGETSEGAEDGDAAAEAEAEEPAPEQPATEEAAAEPPDEAEPEPEPEAEPEPEPEPEPAEAEPAPEAPTDDPVAEAPAPDTAPGNAEPETDSADADAPEPPATVEDAADSEAPAPEPQAAESDPPADPPSTEDQAQTDDTAGDQDAERPRLTAEQRERRAERRRERAAAAAAAEADAADTEVTTEEVTEDTARSSSEDFETTAAGDDSDEDEDEGLSNFERALLLGLGAVAVGSILDNGDEVVSNTGDRIVVDRDGELVVLKNDDELLRQPGTQIRTQTFNDGSTRTTITRPNGAQVITVRAADGTVLRRERILPDGTGIVLFDDTAEVEEVALEDLPAAATTETALSRADTEALRRALAASSRDVGRRFSLGQVREIYEVRALAPEVNLDAVTFDSGSAAITPSEAEELSALGRAISDIVADDPRAVFLIEGHTDAVGDARYNLALSDRRAESVALALTEYFDVPPENLVIQGYGESRLKVQTEAAERQNRRATVRNITGLLR